MASDRHRDILDERAQILLRLLVDKYIREGQPVGSRTLSREAGLDLSPATIRNIVSDLEELGFVRSPHTSAGTHAWTAIARTRMALQAGERGARRWQAPKTVRGACRDSAVRLVRRWAGRGGSGCHALGGRIPVTAGVQNAEPSTAEGITALGQVSPPVTTCHKASEGYGGLVGGETRK